MKERNLYLAVLLTLLQPGLGHMYTGMFLKGFIPYLLFSGITMVFLPEMLKTFSGLLLLVIMAVVFYCYMVTDVILVFKKQTGREKWYNKWYYYVAVYLLSIGATSFIRSADILKTDSIQAYRVPSDSMANTLKAGDYIYADMNAFVDREPEAGELVVIKTPTVPSDTYISRILAKPGDEVTCSGSTCSVNGKRIDIAKNAPQPIPDEGTLGTRRERLKRNDYFVVKDNPRVGVDSRMFGPLPRQNIIGKPLYIYFSSDVKRIGDTF